MKKTALVLASLLLAAPALAADQTRQQVRDPSTHADGASPTQQRTRSRDATQDASRDQARERSRAMNGGGAGKMAGSGGGSGSGNAYRGGK